MLSSLLGAWTFAAAETPAPVFHLDDVEGQAFDLSAHLGKEVILLDFWATFCVPCLTELESYRNIQLGIRIRAGGGGPVGGSAANRRPRAILRAHPGVSVSGAAGSGTASLSPL